MGWRCALTVAAWLIGAAPALAAPAATTPPPATGNVSPSTPSTPALSCQSATLAQLTALLNTLPRESVTLPSVRMPDSAENTVTYLHPNATGNVEFVAFLANPAAHYQYDTAAAVPITVSRVDHTPPDDTQSSGQSVGDNQNAYDLHLQTPSLGDLTLWEKHTLVIFACRSGAGLDVPVGYAVRRVTVSHKGGSTIVGLSVVAFVYLLAGTLVWLQRKSDAARGSKLKATFPTRTKEIDAWKWYECLDPVRMSSDMFDRASLSKLQILFFVLVVSFGVTYSLIRTGALSDLSSSIVFLLGIPALGTLGNQAAAVTRDRLSLDNWAWLAMRGVFPINDPGNDKPHWRDLVMSEAELDLYKLQALMFSVIVGIALISSGLSNLATFKVPDTLLQILGLSQAVFVGGRWTRPTTLGDLDDMVTELRHRAADLTAAVNSGVDVDATGKPLQAADAPRRGRRAPKSEAPSMEEARRQVPTAVGRYEETQGEVKLLLEQLTHRDVRAALLEDPFMPTAA